MDARKQPKVLVVGGGPTGMTVAFNLARNGIDCRIIERRATKESSSKALSINSLSCQILNHYGMLEDVEKTSCKTHSAYIHWEGHRIFHMAFDHLNARCTYFLMQPQPRTEKTIEEHLNRLGIMVEYGYELVDLEDKGKEVLASVRDTANHIATDSYDVVVGCDGSRSKVRDLIGAEFTGYNYDMHFAMADVKADWKGGSLKDAHYFVNERGFSILIPLDALSGYHRVVVKQSGPLTDDDLTFDQVVKAMNDYGPKGLAISDPIWLSKAAFYNRLASFTRKNRVFLAGDASHLFSPIGGLGMNTGLGDALNLSWKLVYFLKGLGGEKLLQSYITERLGLAKELANRTDTSTALISRIYDRFTPEQEQSYLPLVKNRKLIRKILPEASSGLSQFYPAMKNNPWVEDRYNRLIGGQTPYFRVASKDRVWDTYDLFKTTKHIFIAFIEGATCDYRHVEEQLQDYKDMMEICLVWSPSEQRPASGLYSWLTESVRHAFGLELGEYVLIRPDFFIEFCGTINNLESLGYFIEDQYGHKKLILLQEDKRSVAGSRQ